MNQFVESLKRLYCADKLTAEKIINLFKSGKITDEERKYILAH